MLSFFRWVLFFIALFVTLMGGALYLGHELLVAQGPLGSVKRVVIPRGAGPAIMSKVLREEGVIAHPLLFRVALMIDPAPKQIKAGEYEIPARASMLTVVEILQSGKQVQRRLTVPEGTTTAEILEMVRKTEALAGEITVDVKEGDLLPETYFYSRDDTRDGLLLRMKEDMEKTLDEAWRKRAGGLPLANRQQALTLASIIEKETGVASERSKVSAVFINRLRQKMKLESDPTTIYGIWERYEGNLHKSDLEQDTPWNTYTRGGLPAGPIGNPGEAAIEAALHPAASEYLYFVSHNDGTHEFTRTYEEHLAAVRKFQLNSAARKGKSWRDRLESLVLGWR